MSEGSGDVDVPLQYSPGIGCEDKGAAFGESCSGSKKTLTACAWTVWGLSKDQLAATIERLKAAAAEKGACASVVSFNCLLANNHGPCHRSSHCQHVLSAQVASWVNCIQ
eukprot:1158370-Pelagomonas_calceolata.AAC.4